MFLYFIDMLEPDHSTCIDGAGFMRGDPAWSWQTPGYAPGTQLLWVITQGRALLQSGPKRYQLRRGDCLLLDVSQRQEASHIANDYAHIAWVLFHRTDARDQRLLQRPGPEYSRPAKFQFIVELTERAIDGYFDPTPASHHAVHWLEAACIELAKQQATPPYSGTQLVQYRRINDLCNRIRALPHLQWDLSDLARIMQCTDDHFVRLFKQFTQTTPRQFVLQARMDQACQLLKMSSYSVSRIAEMLGYANVYYFSKQFKQRTGVTPTAFRRQ